MILEIRRDENGEINHYYYAGIEVIGNRVEAWGENLVRIHPDDRAWQDDTYKNATLFCLPVNYVDVELIDGTMQRHTVVWHDDRWRFKRKYDQSLAP